MLAYILAGVIGGMTSAVITLALGCAWVAALLCYVGFGIAGLTLAALPRMAVPSWANGRTGSPECGPMTDLGRAG